MSWFNIFKKKKAIEKKDSRTFSLLKSKGSGGVIWTPNDYENYSKETYLKNVIAFRSIDEIAKNVSMPSWGHYRKLSDGTREQINDSWVVDLFKRPNPDEGWAFLMLKATAYLVMSGNTFFERIKPETGPNKDDIKEIYSLRPDRFQLSIDDVSGRIKQYIYEINSSKIKWDVDPLTNQADVLHIKNFHPIDDWWGAAATESAAREIDTSNSATEWNKNILDNEGRPGMVFTLVGQVGEESFDQLERHLDENHAGAKNAGKNLIITGDSGTKAEPYGFSMKDMDFHEGGRELARRIALAYGVPPMLLGIPGDLTYSNYKEARLAFWESTIYFYLNYFKTELNNWMFEKDSDEFIDYNLEDIPALAIKRDMLWDRAQKSDFMTINEKRELVGQEKLGEEGDVVLVQSSMIPLQTLTSQEPEENELEENELEEEKLAKELRDQGYNEDEVNSMLGFYGEK